MKYLSLIVLVFFSWSCVPKPFDLGNEVDLESFKKDRGGCESIRTGQIEALKVVSDSILTHSENEVLTTLGRYDFQILDRKNQKVFVYYLEKGPHCEAIQNESSAISMAIYFNATSLAKEVTFQQGMP